jgi:hypothetical protein
MPGLKMPWNNKKRKRPAKSEDWLAKCQRICRQCGKNKPSLFYDMYEECTCEDKNIIGR